VDPIHVRSAPTGYFVYRLAQLSQPVGHDSDLGHEAIRNGSQNSFMMYLLLGDRGGTVVKVLRYKSEGRWFDPSWCQWNFSLT